MKTALIELIKLRSEPTVLLLDMDNTIVDYSSPIAQALSEKSGCEVTYNNWTNITENDKEMKELQKDKQKEDGFFFSLKPIKGALSALKEMEEMGFTIFIVSSPSISSDTCHSDKVRWLKQYLGDDWARKLVLTKDKTIIYGHILVDDRVDINGVCNGRRPWKHVLFTQHYNSHITDKPHIKGWDNWIETIYNTIFLDE